MKLAPGAGTWVHQHQLLVVYCGVTSEPKCGGKAFQSTFDRRQWLLDVAFHIARSSRVTVSDVVPTLDSEVDETAL